MRNKLKQYYKDNGISAESFNCEYQKCCSLKSNRFTTAKEAYIGEKYGSDGIPKLLFLSLDSGDSKPNNQQRTMEYLLEEESKRTKMPAHHWGKTFKLATSLLKKYINIENNKVGINQYFAHTNSAKCCQNKEGNAQADTILFKACRDYLKGEIEILNPDIIVTQGEMAKKVIKQHFDTNKNQITILNKKSLWFHSVHPTAWQGGNFSKCEKKYSSDIKNHDCYFDKWREQINDRFY